MTLTISDNGNNWGASGRTIDAHRVTQAWTEYSATWNCADDANPSNSSADCSGATEWEMSQSAQWPFVTAPTATTLIQSGQTGAIDLDVTADVAAWLDGSAGNFGWLLRKTSESATGRIEFASREVVNGPSLSLVFAGTGGTGTTAGTDTGGAPALVEHRFGFAGDTDVRQGTPNQNFSNEPVVRLQASGNNRGLYALDTAALGATFMDPDEVVSARIDLTISENFSNWGSGSRPIALHRVEHPFVAQSATWNCALDGDLGNSAADCEGMTAWSMMGKTAPPPYALAPSASALIDNGTEGVISLDVTADLRAVLRGEWVGHGWLLKKANESQSGHIEFHATGHVDGPVLIVHTSEAGSGTTGSASGDGGETDTETGGLGCVADSFEPNDTHAEAAPISLGSHPGLTLLGEEDDWFSVEVCGGGQLTAQALFAHDDTAFDLDLGVYNVSGALVGGSFSNTDGELVVVDNVSENPATLFVRAYPAAIDTCDSYALIVTEQDCGGGTGTGTAGDDGGVTGGEGGVTGGDGGVTGASSAGSATGGTTSAGSVSATGGTGTADSGVPTSTGGTATGGDTGGGDGGGEPDPDAIPPDPATIAPPLDMTVPTHLYEQVNFLFEGPDRIQLGVEPGTIDPIRVNVVRGQVITRDGAPLPGALVTVVDHPEFGQTRSRADGWFDLAVNGGGRIRIRFELDGFLPADREVNAQWMEWSPLREPVALVELDPESTVVDFSTTQVHLASPVLDEDGSRQATVVFPEGVVATKRLADGGTAPLATMTVHATEYTVGPNGPNAMPAELPPKTMYTYAIDYAVDELGPDESVEFSSPVWAYELNFLDLRVGEFVPSGYYNPNTGHWEGEPDGQVIQIVGETAGLAEIDADGDAMPDDGVALAALGFTDGERSELLTLFPIGTELWRVPIRHFSTYDFNLGFVPNDPSQPNGSTDGDNSNCEGSAGGSIIECASQVLGERVPVAGTGLSLNYRTSRVPGRQREFKIRIDDAVAEDVGEFVDRVDIDLLVAGRTIRHSTAPVPQDAHLHWDGLDVYGRVVQGATPIAVEIAYVMGVTPTATMTSTQQDGAQSSFGYSGNGRTMEWNGRRGGTVRVIQRFGSDRLAGGRIGAREGFTPIDGGLNLGVWDARLSAASLGGWTLSNHHTYDAESAILYRGDGQQRRLDQRPPLIEVYAGDGVITLGPNSVPIPREDLRLSGPIGGVDQAPDGTVYIGADCGGGRATLIKIGLDGMAEHVAGDCSQGLPESWDPQPAKTALLGSIIEVVADSRGNVFLLERVGTRTSRVRRIDTHSGIITPSLGGGTVRPNIWGEVDTPQPGGSYELSEGKLAIGPDDSLYIGTWGGSAGGERVGNIMRVMPDGTTVHVAGNLCLASDDPRGLFAALKCFAGITALAVDDDGSVWFGDGGRLIRIDPEGKLDPVGCVGSLNGDAGDGWDPSAVSCYVSGMRLDTNGRPVVFDGLNNRIRYMDSDGRMRTLVGGGAGWSTILEGQPARRSALQFMNIKFAVARDGSVLMGGAANKLYRVQHPNPGLGLSHSVVQSEDGSLDYVFDSRGIHQQTVDRVSGTPLWTFDYTNLRQLKSITDARGRVTLIERDSSGQATAIVSPDGHRTELTTDANGYLASITPAPGSTLGFDYRPDGLLETMVSARGAPTSFDYDDDGRLISDLGPTGYLQTLTPNITNGVREVVKTTGMGRTRTVKTETKLTGGVMQRFTDTREDGSASTTEWNDKDIATSTSATGMTTVSTAGELGPATKQVVSTPGENGATPRILSVDRSLTEFVDPDDNVTAVLERSTVNGKAVTVTTDRIGQTRAAVSPQGRQAIAQVDLTTGLVLSEQTGDLATTYMTYDPEGRLVEMVQGMGADERSLALEYDARGNLKKLADGAGRETQLWYDAQDRVNAQTLPDGRIVGFRYDASDNVVGITPAGRPEHSFTYNTAEQGESYDPPTTPQVFFASTTYAYNADRQLERVTRPDGQEIEYVYELGSSRLGEITTPLGNYAYAYDDAQRVEAALDPFGGSLAYAYDGDLVLSEAMSGTINGSVSWAYDHDFRVSSERVNGAHEVTFGYDLDGLLMWAGAESMQRSAASGLLTGSTLGVVGQTVDYNTVGEVMGLHYTASGATPLYDAVFTRDAVGRIQTKTETVDGSANTFCYVYDDASRLVEVWNGFDGTGCWGLKVEEYAYDFNSNRTYAANSAGVVDGTEVVVDEQDRLLQYGEWTYTYSANGELDVKTSANGPVYDFDYDVMGNLRRVDLPDGRVVEYVTDARDRRVGKKLDGTVVQGFVYGGQLSPIAELDGNGAVVSRFVYGTRGHVPDYMVKGGATYRVVSDYLGSVVAVVDAASGEVVQRLEYDAWGRVLVDTAPGFQPFGYAGGVWDRDTGLVRFGARDYDPETGRWTAKDPIGLAGGLSTYLYAGGNPVSLADVEGLAPADGWWGDLGDFAAGFGDTISEIPFTNTSISELAREWLGVNDVVDKCSNAYGAGRVAAYAHMALQMATSVAKLFAKRASAKVVPKRADKFSRAPKSLQDQMTLDAARRGAGNKIIDNLGDAKFKGMEKWEYRVKSANGRDSVVHYVRDPATGKLMDFKFTKHSTDSMRPWGNDPKVPPIGP